MHLDRFAKSLIAAAAMAGAVAACASEQQMLEQNRPEATSAALARGKFDLDCPQATATVLSSDFIQPAIQGPWVSGINREEYTVGIEGCGKRTTYVVICQEGSTCFAAHPRDGQ